MDLEGLSRPRWPAETSRLSMILEPIVGREVVAVPDHLDSKAVSASSDWSVLYMYRIHELAMKVVASCQCVHCKPLSPQLFQQCTVSQQFHVLPQEAQSL